MTSTSFGYFYIGIKTARLASKFQMDFEVERFWLRKSATIHAAPVIARFCALPAQLISLCGSVNGAGIHTSNPKPISIAVRSRDASRAKRMVSSAMAASANAIVVVIAQNGCPGGIHFGTKSAVAESYPPGSGNKARVWPPYYYYDYCFNGG